MTSTILIARSISLLSLLTLPNLFWASLGSISTTRLAAVRKSQICLWKIACERCNTYLGLKYSLLSFVHSWGDENNRHACYWQTSLGVVQFWAIFLPIPRTREREKIISSYNFWLNGSIEGWYPSFSWQWRPQRPSVTSNPPNSAVSKPPPTLPSLVNSAIQFFLKNMVGLPYT
jgi:hypothetical protein